MEHDSQDASRNKQKEIIYTTEEEREEALMELIARIIVTKIIRDNPGRFPNEAINIQEE